MFYIYFIYSDCADLYYVGHSDNPLRRLVEHNSSEQLTFSSKFRPWRLVAIFICSANRSEAMKIEKFIKKQKSRKLIEKIIHGADLHGPIAQLVRVPHLRD